MKSIFLTAALSVLYFCISAQSIITGQILDAKNQPIEFANVLLLSNADSSLVKGNITDANGNYMLEAIFPGDYLLSVTMLGFQTKYTSIKIAKEQREFSQPKIFLFEDAEQLNEVIVKARRPLFEQKIDRTVINVQNSVTSTGSWF